MERIYDKQEGYSPYVCYAIFTKQPFTIKQTQSLPCANLELIPYDQTQLQKIITGAIGSLLKSQDEALYEEVISCMACYLVRGEIIKSDTLDYLTEILSFVNAYTKDAIAVLDVLSIQWYDITKWHTLFGKEFYIHDHIQILLSQETGGAWLHTRGMMKYGRPDISILDIPKSHIHEMKLLMDQIIYYEALGAMVLQPSKFKTAQATYTIHPVFYNDFENFDFNNAFIEMKYAEIIKEA